MMKTSIHKLLYSEYGSGVVKSFRELEKCHLKIARHRNHRVFNLKCLNEDLIPKSVKINYHFKTAKELNIVHKCERQLLNARVGQSISQLETLHEKRTTLTNSLHSQLSRNDFVKVQNFVIQASEREFNIVRDRQQTKLDNIKLDYDRNPPAYKKDTKCTTHIPEDIKRRWVVNRSSKDLSPDEISLLSRGPKFAITQDRIPIEDIIPVIESGIQNLPECEADATRYEIVRAIKQTKTLESNITSGEREALDKLKRDRSIKVLPADKGTAMVVMDSKEYDAKCLKMLSDKDTYEVIKKGDPTASLQRQLIDKLKAIKKSGNLSDSKYSQMRPSGNKSPAPKFYGLPKIHKDGTPLRGIVSSCGSLSYPTAKELARILGPLVGKNGHGVKNTKDFVDRIVTRTLSDGEEQVSFDVTNLFGNVKVKRALSVARKRLENDKTLKERTDMTVDQIMDLLEFCLSNTYFVFHGVYYRQKFGAAMGSPVSPIVANLFMEDFELEAISTAPSPPKCWDRYVDDTYAIVNKDNVDTLHQHINHNMNEPTIKFTKEPASEDGSVPFLDTKCIPQPDGSIRTVVYRKPTHTDLYVQWDSAHPLSAKLSVVSSLFHRASVVCRNEQDLQEEHKHLTTVLQYNGYPKWAITKGQKRCDRRLASTQDISDNSENSGQNSVKSKCFVVMDYIKGLSERIREILKRKGVQVYFKSSNTLRNILVSPKEKDPKGFKQDIVYHIPCNYDSCSASYIGETCRMLEERIKDHITDPNSSIKQHHITTGHPLPSVNDNGVKVIGREVNSFKRKVKEAIFIKTNDPVLNRNVGKFNLPPIYDQLFEDGGQDKLVIKTQVKEAIPKMKIKRIAIGKHQIVRD